MIYNAGSFQFGDLNSANYNVWISGGGTYDSPERDVEFISIDGRNGDIAQDNGRFQNVEITYPAFISRGFDQYFDSFRSAMLLQRGYQRLYDTYHPLEYRMAVLKSAITPDTGIYNRSGKFSLTFNCKPQRFLLSGEEAVKYSLVSLGGLDASGANTADEFAYRVEYMSVTPSTLFEASIKYLYTTNAALMVAFYTSSKAFISASEADVSENMTLSLVVPSNAAYARIMYGEGGSSYAGATGLTVNNNGVKTSYGDGGILLVNPTGYEAQPIIYIKTGGNAATFDIDHLSPLNVRTVTNVAIADFSSTGRSDVVIDSTIGDSYSEYFDAIYLPTSLNEYVTITEGGQLADYPMLQAGRTIIKTATNTGTSSTDIFESISVKAGWWLA